jgi:thioredoxin-like negative regulator of GroEL
MYRLGHVHMQAGRHPEALETFFQVVTGAKGVTTLARVGEAARRGFVAAYVPIGNPDKAYAAFQRVDRARANEMLTWLAEAYVAAGSGDKAKRALRQKP